MVEEKRGFIEDQLVRILYNMDASSVPPWSASATNSGATLLPSEGELTPTMVAAALVARLRRLGHQSPVLEQRLARLEAFEHPAVTRAPMALQRTPVFLLGLPAQHLDQGAGRQPRHGRHRLSRHGAVDPEPAHRDHLAYGRRGRELDRSGALHQRAAHLPEPRRRHLHPFRPAGAAGRVGRRRQHHLQDPLQRRGRHDRRTARRGRLHGLADRPSGLGRRRQARRDRFRRSRQISEPRIISRKARPSIIAANWTGSSANCARSRVSRC